MQIWTVQVIPADILFEKLTWSLMYLVFTLHAELAMWFDVMDMMSGYSLNIELMKFVDFLMNSSLIEASPSNKFLCR